MEKYDKNRSKIKTGDVMLFVGTSLLAKLIRRFDKSKYNHTGVAYWVQDRLFIIDAFSDGVRLVPMIRRINTSSNFCMVRKIGKDYPKLALGLKNILDKVEKGQPYGFEGLFVRLLKLKFGIIDKGFDVKKKEVCADISIDFLKDYGCICYNSVFLPSPQDIIRFKDDSLVVLLDE